MTEVGRPHIVPVTFAVDGNYIYTAVDAKPKNETARTWPAADPQH